MKMANNTRKRKGRAAVAKHVRSKRFTLKQTPARNGEMRATRDMLFTRAVNIIHEAENGPVERAPYGSMQLAIDYLALHGHKGVQPHQIYYHKKKKMNKAPVSVIRTSNEMVAHHDHNSAAAEGLLCLARATTGPAKMVVEVTTETAVTSGRPKGTTVAEIQLQKAVFENCLTSIVIRYDELKKEANYNNKKIKQGALKMIIAEEKVKFGLKDVQISEETIRTRVKRGQTHTISGRGLRSPLEEIENVFVEFFIQMSSFKRSLSVVEGIALVNSIISGTKYEQYVKDFQEKFCHGTMKDETTKGMVGEAYWANFMK